MATIDNRPRCSPARPSTTSTAWSPNGRVPYVKVGRFVRFDHREIATWLQGTRVPEQRMG